MSDQLEMQPVPTKFWVHGGNFQECDLIRALDEVMYQYGINDLPGGAMCRAADWLAQKYGTPR